MSESLHQSTANRISHNRSDNWDRLCCTLSCQGRRRGSCHDDINWQTNQLFSCIIELVFALEPAIFNDDILTFGIAHFLKTLPESIDERIGWFSDSEDADPMEAFRLLGVDHRNPSEKNKSQKIQAKPWCHLTSPKGSTNSDASCAGMLIRIGARWNLTHSAGQLADHSISSG